jgi:N,N'-diacetyllegionaminate synthase
MRIASRRLDLDGRVFVVAEIGNNHDGSVRQAERLIEAAAESGADAVKFQTHIADAEMLPSAPTPPHFDEPRYELTKRMELSLDDHLSLKHAAEERGLVFFSSPFSVEAVELLEEVDVPLYKIASGEVSNPPLLEAVAATKKPVLLSSGMSGLPDVEGAMAVFRFTHSQVVVLQCTSTYPCPPEAVNLRAMVAMGHALGVPYGISDHTSGINVSVAAVALGAAVVEKHFTLSKRLYGPDHGASLEPHELKGLVDGVREVEAALGSGAKEREAAQDAVRATFEKSVVSAHAIPVGTELTASMLTTKRPGTGIPALRLPELLSRRAARDIRANVLIEERDLV